MIYIYMYMYVWTLHPTHYFVDLIPGTLSLVESSFGVRIYMMVGHDPRIRRWENGRSYLHNNPQLAPSTLTEQDALYTVSTLTVTCSPTYGHIAKGEAPCSPTISRRGHSLTMLPFCLPKVADCEIGRLFAGVTPWSKRRLNRIDAQARGR